MRSALQPALRSAFSAYLRGPFQAAYSFFVGSLFGNTAAKGAWYQPSDRATLNQLSTGTTPVTAVEDVIGLILDKRLGLVPGPELVTNGTFDTATTGWTASNSTLSIVSAALRITISANGAAYATRTITCVVGKSYQASMQVVADAVTGIMSLSIGTSAGGTQTSTVSIAAGAGTISLIFIATATTQHVSATAAAGALAAETFDVDNITVKLLDGNHKLQATAGNRPVLSARLNLLTYSEEFNNAAWTKTRATITANATVAPDGTTTADTLVEDTTVSNTHIVLGTSTGVAPSVTSVFSIFVKAATRSSILMSLHDNAATVDAVSAAYDLVAGTVSIAAASVGLGSGAVASISGIGGGWFKCVLSGKPSTGGTTTQARISLRNAPTGSTAYTGDGTSGLFIWGAHLNIGSVADRYQRIAAATDYDTVGFPAYIKYDGSNDSLTSTFGAGTLTSDMDVFIAVKRNAATGFVAGAIAPASGSYFGSVLSTGIAAANANAGTPTYYINGMQVPGLAAVTEVALHTAMPEGVPLIFEARNVALDAWTGLSGGYFSGGYPGSISEYGKIVCPAQSAASRTAIRDYLAGEAGVSGYRSSNLTELTMPNGEFNIIICPGRSLFAAVLLVIRPELMTIPCPSQLSICTLSIQPCTQVPIRSKPWLGCLVTRTFFRVGLSVRRVSVSAASTLTP